MHRYIVKAIAILIAFLLTWLVGEAGAADRVWRLDDFEDGNLVAAPGLSWFVLADDVAGGESLASLRLVAGGAGGSGRALRVEGRRSGRRGSFAGAWVSLERTGGPVDLRHFDRIRLRVKGPGRLLVGFRDGSVNHMAPVEAGAEWRDIEVPFDRLAPQGRVPEGTRFDPGALWTFGISTPYLLPGEEVPASEIGFEIDDVELAGRGEGPAAPAPSGPPGGISVRPFAAPGSIPGDGWIVLSADPAGDANAPLLPDATRLEAIPGGADGRTWFRLTLREAPHDRWMGVNVALDVDGDPENGQPWWGANKAFRYDRLVTIYCFHVEGGCQGYVGVADAAQVAAGNMTGEGGADLRFAMDRERRAFVVGVPRAALRLGAAPARLVAAVGSALLFGDDVPGQGAAVLP